MNNPIIKMKHIPFVYRLLIHSLIVMTGFFAVNCRNRESKLNELEPNASSGLNAKDTCNVCPIDSFYLKQASSSNGQRVLIDEPVAIQFFNQVRLADKYEKEDYDTLMKLFNMKHWSDRNAIYALKDQYFYFTKVIKPVLIENSIKIMDSVSTNYLLEFQVSNGNITVNPGEYKEQDGVLFFTPGKKPLFWTADREEIHCKDGYGLAGQYFRCPPKSK